MNKVKYFFVCTGIYQLYTSAYLASKIDDSNSIKILIFVDLASKNVPVEIFNEYFDKIYYQHQYDVIPRPFGLATKMLLGGWLFPFSRFGKECYFKSKNCTLYVFNDFELIANRTIQALRKKKKHIILVDEGTLTYTTNQYWTKNVQKLNFWDLIIGIFRKPLAEHNHSIDTVMCRYPNLLPEIKKSNRNVVPMKNPFLDKEWVEEIIKVSNHSFRDEVYPQSIFWLGQPFVPSGITDEDEINFLRKLKSIIGDSFRIYIKPHPRDHLEKYGDLLQEFHDIKILNVPDWIPFEIIAYKYKPNIVMTDSSSAGDIVLEFNEDSIVIYCARITGHILDREIETVFNGERKYYPSSVDELRNIIFEKTKH